MRYLITQSLLNSWMYMFDCYEDASEDARNDFLACVRREPTAQNDIMKRGESFENAVQAALNGNYAAADEHAKAWATKGHEIEEKACIFDVAGIVKGGAYQVKAYKDIDIAGMQFKAMAKCDWVRAGVIFDCKRVNTYEVGKYLNSPQHLIYLAVIGGAKEFKYIVSDGRDVFTESYTRETQVSSAEDLISAFVSFLRSEPELMAIYTDKWGAL